jgi:hypothetical protein
MSGSDLLVLTLVVILLLIAVAVWLTFRRRHSEHLRERFGEEYDRTVQEHGRRTAAEADLEQREKRVAGLEIRPLTADERERYAREWSEVKSVFVDSPAEAVLHADRMLANMMQAKGFPMADFDRRYEDLTVGHGEVARHYREGHAIAEKHNGGGATTEDMRQAMKHYEVLYNELVADGADEPLSTDRGLDRGGVSANVADFRRDGGAARSR